jgi:hypothetical protein
VEVIMGTTGSARTIGQILASPLGAAVVFGLFAPTGGCAVRVQAYLPCPNGQQENFFGSTLGGLVGTLDYGGATIVALVVAGLIWLAVGE